MVIYNDLFIDLVTTFMSSRRWMIQDSLCPAHQVLGKTDMQCPQILVNARQREGDCGKSHHGKSQILNILISAIACKRVIGVFLGRTK